MKYFQGRKADGTHTTVIWLARIFPSIDGRASINELQCCASSTDHQQQALRPIDRYVGPFSAGADVYLPLRKPHQRFDEIIGYGRDLIEEMTDHGATHKSFEAFVLCYNRTQECESRRKGLVGHARFQSMHAHTVRNAWFACSAFDKSLELGCPLITFWISQRESRVVTETSSASLKK